MGHGIITLRKEAVGVLFRQRMLRRSRATIKYSMTRGFGCNRVVVEWDDSSVAEEELLEGAESFGASYGLGHYGT
jgi:hypothetical protein